mmetsp:Transcript_4904/g.8963  ORF Transcript_4904/g.8963 Transcript_4904/m.8963 type:complete len:385 (-) Transcript_4904:1174-2328(-)
MADARGPLPLPPRPVRPLTARPPGSRPSIEAAARPQRSVAGPPPDAFLVPDWQGRQETGKAASLVSQQSKRGSTASQQSNRPTSPALRSTSRQRRSTAANSADLFAPVLPQDQWPTHVLNKEMMEHFARMSEENMQQNRKKAIQAKRRSFQRAKKIEDLDVAIGRFKRSIHHSVYGSSTGITFSQLRSIELLLQERHNLELLEAQDNRERSFYLSESTTDSPTTPVPVDACGFSLYEWMAILTSADTTPEHRHQMENALIEALPVERGASADAATVRRWEGDDDSKTQASASKEPAWVQKFREMHGLVPSAPSTPSRRMSTRKFSVFVQGPEQGHSEWVSLNRRNPHQRWSTTSAQAFSPTRSVCPSPRPPQFPFRTGFPHHAV